LVIERVAVIGGGYAGLAAAVVLAQHGIPVSVFEAAKQLGGRARRVTYRGLDLDNGQHLLLGAYRETLRLARLVHAGREAWLRLPLDLDIPGHFRFKTPPLPAPLHLAFALMTASGLAAQERFDALRFMLNMRSRGFTLTRDCSVISLLATHRQSDRAIRLLWEPLCVAALNTPLAVASAQVFLNVLRDSFNRERSDSDMVLPLVDLSRLFPDAAAEYVQQHGGNVLTGVPVRSIAATEQGFTLTTAGEEQAFSQVICAVSPQRMSALTQDLPQLAEAARMAQALAYHPIYTIYLQYPQDVSLSGPLLGLTGTLAQWVCDRGYTHQTPGMLAVVISSDGAHQGMPHAKLADQVHKEINEALGPLPQPLWHEVIAEKRATFSCSVSLERPAQVTPLEHFYLAGDYTAGDYPATIEAAVQSGVKCAAHILQGRQAATS
jgi:squalene-associated FAD-dependent desaturase